jgi:hypothetical protein
MITFPVLTFLRVENYGLFPGKPVGKGIEWDFKKGLCLIAGINGLGKTTLLTMLLRVFSGPFDLTGDGLPETLESVIPESPILLKTRVLRYFAQRVADQGREATVTLKAKFGKDEITISRHLFDLRLLLFAVNGEPRDLGANRQDREAAFQQLMCTFFDLSSFVDVLLVLHHVIFFMEVGLGALWDENAQRHLLRALYLEKDLAAQVAAAERRVVSTDSRARNISASAFAIEERLRHARASAANVSEIAVELAAEQKLLDAELMERERLDSLLDELDEQRKEVRREYEQAKLTREEADNAVERLKFAVLSQLFPRMEDAARLVVLKVLTTGECLVCGANAQRRREELEALLAKGDCPACGATPEEQKETSPAFNVNEHQLKDARSVANLARTEEQAMRTKFEASKSRYDEILTQLASLNSSIQERKLRERHLSAELPPEAEEIKHLQETLDVQRRAQKQAESERAAAAKKLSALLESGRGGIEKQTKQLSSSFRRMVKQLIAEDADLVRIVAKARLMQGKEGFDVPAFRPRMTAANRPDKPQRNSPDDVSESQRELIDLAFRFGLIESATNSADCSLIMETPEASLDELAMQRVGLGLHAFAIRSENRLIVTSNLTNAGMITYMFGGPTKSPKVVEDRRACVLDLLDVAAPNHAVEQDRPRYKAILKKALAG